MENDDSMNLEIEPITRGIAHLSLQDHFERELLNTAARSTRTPVFEPHWLAPLRDVKNDYRPPPYTEYKEFFIGVDPAGDGFSWTTLVSVVIDRGNPRPFGVDYRLIAVACEVVPKKLVEVDLGVMIVNHALLVRQKIPELANATAVICVESNTILIAQHVTSSIKRNPRAYNMGIMMENASARKTGQGVAGIDVRAGTRTTNQSKESIIAKLQDLLQGEALHFHHLFFVPHPDKQPQNQQGVENARKLFVDEFANMCAEFVQSKGPVASQQKGYIRYKGYQADGHKANDDKLMALGFCLQCEPLYRLEPRLFMRTVQQGTLPPL